MNEDDAELRNPFPSPPSHYTNYTTHNLTLLRLLKERAPPDVPLADVHQHEILNDQTDIPDWPLVQLEKPRVDWILDDPEGYYDVFGDRWFVRLYIDLDSVSFEGLDLHMYRSKNQFPHWQTWVVISSTLPIRVLVCLLFQNYAVCS
jgi:hypothetical protein